MPMLAASRAGAWMYYCCNQCEPNAGRRNRKRQRLAERRAWRREWGLRG